ncbi:MAG: hypothetical protein KF826_06940 [Xanthobacteraceae bacterium]|nr:hypothetical protein [Xanthobacteraceae bacterium]MBX3534069.1 hypothetical protein [Xanthobacteraceae bacterium]MBX3548802.1 hypothetical protein [Xanthobacteraceae bacterium]MCW5674432.1 hypothetical protein [Xanthobacteraceae bacterium]MCW5678750.1 hypothetical protein [Xanthobacteraceae bacterium]
MRFVAGAILLSMLAGQALAADLPLRPRTPPAKTAPQPKAVPPVKMLDQNEFDQLGADCIEATNACQRFVRANDGKFDATNNIGISCQPQALSCSKRR